MRRNRGVHPLLRQVCCRPPRLLCAARPYLIRALISQKKIASLRSCFVLAAGAAAAARRPRGRPSRSGEGPAAEKPKRECIAAQTTCSSAPLPCTHIPLASLLALLKCHPPPFEHSMRWLFHRGRRFVHEAEGADCGHDGGGGADDCRAGGAADAAQRAAEPAQHAGDIRRRAHQAPAGAGGARPD